MSTSLYNADRNTHIKIVTVTVAAAIVVAIVGTNARIPSNGSVVHAVQPIEYSVREGTIIR